MLRQSSSAVLCAALVLVNAPDALAHDQAGHGTGTSSAKSGEITELTATADPDAAVALTIQVPLGAHVRLTVLGAEPGELHLHGFDVAVDAAEGQPAIFVFHASHAGRFPLEAHVVDPLLGTRGKAVLYVEVRAP